MCTLFLLKFKCFPFLCTLFAFNSAKKGVERNKQLWWACSGYKKYTRCWVMFAADHKRLTGWVSLWDELCVHLKTNSNCVFEHRAGCYLPTGTRNHYSHGLNRNLEKRFKNISVLNILILWQIEENYPVVKAFHGWYILLPSYYFLSALSLSLSHTREWME